MEIKIEEAEQICLHPEHEPATMLYRTPGTYQHTCPACGKITTFTVPTIVY
jgi:hypothetical protein